MSRSPQSLSHLDRRQRAPLAAFIALVALVLTALVVPRGDVPDEGALVPADQGSKYVARDSRSRTGRRLGERPGGDRPGARRRTRPGHRPPVGRGAGRATGALRRVRGPALLPRSRLDRGRPGPRPGSRHGGPAQREPVRPRRVDRRPLHLRPARPPRGHARRRAACHRARRARGGRPRSREGGAAAPPAAGRATARRLPRAPPRGTRDHHRRAGAHDRQGEDGRRLPPALDGAEAEAHPRATHDVLVRSGHDADDRLGLAEEAPDASAAGRTGSAPPPRGAPSPTWCVSSTPGPAATGESTPATTSCSTSPAGPTRSGCCSRCATSTTIAPRWCCTRSC